jgi:hypothetical protein
MQPALSIKKVKCVDSIYDWFIKGVIYTLVELPDRISIYTALGPPDRLNMLGSWSKEAYDQYHRYRFVELSKKELIIEKFRRMLKPNV